MRYVQAFPRSPAWSPRFLVFALLLGRCAFALLEVRIRRGCVRRAHPGTRTPGSPRCARRPPALCARTPCTQRRSAAEGSRIAQRSRSQQSLPSAGRPRVRHCRSKGVAAQVCSRLDDARHRGRVLGEAPSSVVHWEGLELSVRGGRPHTEAAAGGCSWDRNPWFSQERRLSLRLSQGASQFPWSLAQRLCHMPQ